MGWLIALGKYKNFPRTLRCVTPRQEGLRRGVRVRGSLVSDFRRVTTCPLRSCTLAVTDSNVQATSSRPLSQQRAHS